VGTLFYSVKNAFVYSEDVTVVAESRRSSGCLHQIIEKIFPAYKSLPMGLKVGRLIL